MKIPIHLLFAQLFEIIAFLRSSASVINCSTLSFAWLSMMVTLPSSLIWLPPCRSHLLSGSVIPFNCNIVQCGVTDDKTPPPSPPIVSGMLSVRSTRSQSVSVHLDKLTEVNVILSGNLIL